jgi:hypothetical protein
MPCVRPQEQREAVFGRKETPSAAPTELKVASLHAHGGYTVTDIVGVACSASR